jgi:hypothetical protein
MELRRFAMRDYLNAVIKDRNLSALVLPWLFPGRPLYIVEEDDDEVAVPEHAAVGAAPSAGSSSAPAATPAVVEEVCAGVRVCSLPLACVACSFMRHEEQFVVGEVTRGR